MQIPDLSDVPELRPVEPDEYLVRVNKAMDTKANNGRLGIQLICDIVDVDDADTLFHNMWLPMEGDDEGKVNTMNRMLKEFIVAVGLDPAACETEDFNGIEFNALLDVEEYEGRKKNVIKRVVG